MALYFATQHIYPTVLHKKATINNTVRSQQPPHCQVVNGLLPLIARFMGPTVTGHNGHKPKRPQPKRPQTEMSTNRKGHKPERPQTETATNRNDHKPKLSRNVYILKENIDILFIKPNQMKRSLIPSKRPSSINIVFLTISVRWSKSCIKSTERVDHYAKLSG